MSPFYSETLGLTPSAFTLLRDLIHDRTGLYFEDGFDSFLDYYYLLKYDASRPEEWDRLMDTLSVQETYFWRETDQIRALTEVILPEYTRVRPGQATG